MDPKDEVTEVESFDDDLDQVENPSEEDEQDEDQAVSEEQDDNDSEESDSEDDDEDEEVVVSFGDDEPEEQEEDDGTPLIKKLRKLERERAKENRELKKRLEELEKGEQKDTALPEKPKLEDFDYDETKFESAVLDWHEKKREHDKQEQAKQEEAKAAEESWQQSQQKYRDRKQELAYQDFDDVEEVVASTLSIEQQNLIVGGSSDSAKLIYAIGKSPKKLQELASIKDPVKFIWTVAQLEGQVKVEKKTRKPSAQPEKRIKGNGSPSGAIDSTLERLRAEAERTGNYSKVVEYKRKKKN